MVEAGFFIGTVVAGAVELIKGVRERNWSGVATILSALGIGALVGLVDVRVGIPDVTVALGIMLGLKCSGRNASCGK